MNEVQTAEQVFTQMCLQLTAPEALYGVMYNVIERVNNACPISVQRHLK